MGILNEKNGTWFEKGNFKRKTEYLLIAEQNNALRTNYIKAKIDNTQQNCKYWFSGDKDETINLIISEYSKLAEKGVNN